MNYEIIQEDMLSDNDLNETIEEFNSSDESVWHINRHPIDVDRDYPDVGFSSIRLGILLGLALLRLWLRQAKSINSCVISKPYLVIEVNWLNGVEHSSPPYVYVCLSKDENSFEPVVHDEAVVRQIDIDVDMDGLSAKFLKGFDSDSYGSWLIFGKD
jgi:hypothetical protein